MQSGQDAADKDDSQNCYQFLCPTQAVQNQILYNLTRRSEHTAICYKTDVKDYKVDGSLTAIDWFCGSRTAFSKAVTVCVHVLQQQLHFLTEKFYI